MDYDIPVRSNARVLDKRRVAVQNIMPAGLKDVQAEEVRDWMYENLLVRLSAYVLTEQLADEYHPVSLGLPATWWQHLKQDHAPEWFKRRWPVRFRKMTCQIHVRTSGTYPDMKMALPPGEFGDRVIIQELSTSPWTESE
jgi:hypothetical protein